MFTNIGSFLIPSKSVFPDTVVPGALSMGGDGSFWTEYSCLAEILSSNGIDEREWCTLSICHIQGTVDRKILGPLVLPPYWKSI